MNEVSLVCFQSPKVVPINVIKPAHFMSRHLVATAIWEVKFCLLHPKGHSRFLHHEFHVDGLSRLYPDHQLVALDEIWTEDVARNVVELDSDLRLPLIQRCK